MKPILAGFLFLLTWAAPGGPEAAVPYFSNVREVAISAPSRQNYVAVDEEIWNHTRADLADLRLYDGETQAPYALSVQRGGLLSEEREAKILNLGSVGGRTEFDLDVGQLSEYDRVRLRLDAKNFVVSASIEGASAPGQGTRTELGPSTLYDFSRENLGSNSVLKLPASSFRYLHVRLGPGIRPENVKAATVFNLQEKKASWTRVGACRVSGQEKRSTVIACDLASKVPLDRIRFEIAASQVNFRRSVSLSDAQGERLGAGDISRIRVTRGGTTVVSEELAINVSGAHPDHFTVTIEHGDDPPLVLERVQPLALERRIYFDPKGKATLKLYYGDEQLTAPVYDYAKFFREEEAAAQAQLGPGGHNAAFTGRPDDRPWSERHKAILWLAMLLAVAVLAGLALRGLKSES